MERLLAGEKPADLRREYGISDKTFRKTRKRFEREGVEGLTDRSRAPLVIPHRTSPELEAVIIVERRAHPTWGPKKIKAILEQRLGKQMPSASTVGDILARAGLIPKRQRRSGHVAHPTHLSKGETPNDVWCIDYKGQFRLGDRSYCYPLTLTDHATRFFLACEGMPAISDEEARDVCADTFTTYGLPLAMRSDNGAPFASVGLAGLTKLSVFWLKLDIRLERIRPAHPEENGRHERMHLTLKRETARPPRTNLLQQQERFDEFLEEFNLVRPHEALGMKRPADVYTASTRPMPKQLPVPDYLTHDDVVRVGPRGFMRIGRQEFYLGSALGGEYVGIREEGDGEWLVSFANLDLGHLREDVFIPNKPNHLTTNPTPETAPICPV